MFFACALLATSLASCLRDTCEADVEYIRYDPIYVQPTTFRTEIGPEAPRELENPGKIYAYGDYLFINEPQQGIHLFDNSDPENPTAISFIEIEGNVDMAVQNGLLYADNFVDLVVFDIRNPESIEMVGRTEGVFPDYGFDQERGFLIGYEETDIVEKQPCSQGDWFWGRGEVFWVNIDVGVERAFANDASVPSPNQTGVGGSLARFTIGFNRLYVADDSDQLKVFSLRTPEKPELVNTSYIGWAIETIFPYGEHLFIGAANGMHIVSVEDPDNPQHLSTFWHTTACDPVYIDGDYAYVTLRDGTECEGFANQLDVVNIEDLFNPRLVRTFPMHHPIGLSVRDKHLYLCDDDAGLKVFDASDPAQVGNRLLKQIKNINAVDAIALPGRPVLMIIGRDGLYQFDISEPANPLPLSVIPAFES
jgi:hypothetical protein